MERTSAFRGCLLALAVGDAMGYAVDSKTWPQIQADYGPNGLLGYDLANGYADVTSYTQLAVYTANGLLLGQTRGQLRGKMAPYINYIALALREWAASQRRYNLPENIYCWAYKVPELRRRRCMDTWMLNSLDKNKFGTLADPVNRYPSPCSLTTAAAVGMFCAGEGMDLPWEESDRLGAEAVALLYGSPYAFLTGAIVSRIVRSLLTDRDTPLRDVFAQSIAAIEDAYEREYPLVHEIAMTARRGINLAYDRMKRVDAMEALACQDAHQVLAGALCAALSFETDFDSAMICAVNHSGHSAAVAALTGAFLGARMGDGALPEFYLECLEVSPMLQTLAYDLRQGCPMERHTRLFDMDWDRKYLHGEY